LGPLELACQDRQTDRNDDDAGARDRDDEEGHAEREDAEPSHGDGDPAQPDSARGPALPWAAHPSLRHLASSNLHEFTVPLLLPSRRHGSVMILVQRSLELMTCHGDELVANSHRSGELRKDSRQPCDFSRWPARSRDNQTRHSLMM